MNAQPGTQAQQLGSEFLLGNAIGALEQPPAARAQSKEENLRQTTVRLERERRPIFTKISMLDSPTKMRHVRGRPAPLRTLSTPHRRRRRLEQRLQSANLPPQTCGSRLRTTEMAPDVGNRC